MTFSTKFIKELDKLEPKLKAVLLELLAEIERNREQSVPRKEFWEFAQRNEENFQKVWKSFGELTQVQTRTEKRLESLAQAQERTEKRVDGLTHRMEELARAQTKTESALQKLTLRVDKLTDEVGGLSHTVGYGLEDKSYPALEKRLKREFGLDVGRLYRKNLVYSVDNFDEINIYGEAHTNGKKVYVIRENKAQFGPKDVSRFTKLLERVKAYLGKNIFPLALAYHFHPQAEEKLKQKNITYF
ncbi:hypothetical protein GWO43_26470 [candidate division KSB1 bacterium]|nr:hypothetical protein [candidate division KSB1 bacterium]NIR70062.1 hypothetical protein [candidate division KSB1 bacterium]NIS27500.1 hypothetical protein [candidate division KSB1 bacterium]NIT74349.1 hypothetical protein [candidate division KSB1 bacterium]NIU28218.1 hypothetical protein [candidate division KSB1 bacterium]